MGQNLYLKVVKMVNFVLCIFYNHRKSSTSHSEERPDPCQEGLDHYSSTSGIARASITKES